MRTTAPDELDLSLAMGIARTVAWRASRLPQARACSVEREDLIQCALEGVVKAHQRFRPDGGASYKTWLERYAWGEIRHYLRDTASTIRLPRKRRDAPMVMSSLDAPDSAMGTALVERLDSGTRTEGAAEARADVCVFLKRLPPKTAAALLMFYGFDLRQTEIARRLGIDQATVSHRMIRGLRRLRRLTGSHRGGYDDGKRMDASH